MHHESIHNSYSTKRKVHSSTSAPTRPNRSALRAGLDNEGQAGAVTLSFALSLSSSAGVTTPMLNLRMRMCPCARAPVEGVALVNDPVHGAHCLLHRRCRIRPVAEQQVHVLQAQPLQRSLIRQCAGMQARASHNDHTLCCGALSKACSLKPAYVHFMHLCPAAKGPACSCCKGHSSDE